MAVLKNLLISSVFILFLPSCTGGLPDEMLEENKMVSILTRIHIAEAKVSTSYLPTDSALSYYKVLEDTIFKNYGTSRKQYQESYKFYIKNPELIDKVYTRVVDSLSLREAIKKLD